MKYIKYTFVIIINIICFNYNYLLLLIRIDILEKVLDYCKSAWDWF